MGAKIVYKNFAVIDKSQTNPESNGTTISDLKSDFKPSLFASFEQNYMVCDIPYHYYTSEISEPIGYISSTMCDNSGAFPQTQKPSITVTMPEGTTATSNGITLHFSPFSDEYATEILLRWTVSGSTNTINMTFYPNSNIYFCENKVEKYTQLDIVFVKWSYSNRFARIYGIDYGQEIVYEDDNLFSVRVNESANLVSDQIEVNTSNIVILEDKNETFQKNQAYEIWHNDNLIGKHYVKDIKIQGSRFSFTGQDIFGKLDNFDIDAKYVGFYIKDKFNNMGNALNACITDIILDGLDNSKYKITLDASISNIKIYGKFDEVVSRRTALTMLCLAAGAYIDTTCTDGIVIKSTDAALSATEKVAEIKEEVVFSGDSINYKEPYKSLVIKYKDQNGDEKTFDIVNPDDIDSAAKKQMNLKLWSNHIVSSNHELIYTYGKYCFKTGFYNAKALVGYEKIGQRININKKDAFIIKRTLNLDGDKLIADGVYKLV